MSEKSFVMTNGAAHTITEQLKKPNKVIFKCDDGHVIEFNSYEEIYDRLNKLAMMEQKYEACFKPIRIENNDDVYFGCGCCGNLVGCAKITQPQYGSYNKFCMDCGTKNDWSDEE